MIKGTLEGLQIFLEGVRWLRKNPKIGSLIFVPWLLGLVATSLAFAAFIHWDDSILSFLGGTEQTDAAWWELGLRYLVKAFYALMGAVISLVVGAVFANVLSSPFFDLVSIAIEKEVTGQESQLTFYQSLRSLGAEFKKAILILVIVALTLVVPGLNLFSIFISGFLLGVDAFDYPLSRRGWPVRKRVALVRSQFWRIFGMGLWFTIPFLQIIIVPLGVAGGTLLSLKALKEKGQT